MFLYTQMGYEALLLIEYTEHLFQRLSLKKKKITAQDTQLSLVTNLYLHP